MDENQLFSELYLANNLKCLDLIARNNFKVRTLKFQQLCSGLNKLYKQSQQNSLDQEVNYIYLVRYMLLYERLLDTDKNFAEIRFGSEHAKVFAQYLETKTNLERRYEQAQEADVYVTAQQSPVPCLFSSEFITCEELYSALNSQQNVLIVDARPLLDYANSRVSARHSVNIPDQVITPGLSANALGKRIPAEFQDKWEERDNFAALILMDWRTTSSTIEGTKIAIVRSAIIDWDCNRNYREPPVVLSGGYEELIQTYPSLCVNPHILLEKKNNELDDLLTMDDIEYPEKAEAPVVPIEDTLPPSSLSSTTSSLSLDSDTTEGLELEAKKSRENLLQETKELAITRQEVVTKLMEYENRWKELNEIYQNEKDATKRNLLLEEEQILQDEIARLDTKLDDLSAKRQKVDQRLDLFVDFDPQNVTVDTEELKEIIRLEEDDAEKMKILDTIAEERIKALDLARASKPKSSLAGGEASGETASTTAAGAAPAVNRATKPVSPRISPRISPGQSPRGSPRNSPRISPRSDLIIDPRDMTPGLVGLYNIRNTCYMNTIVQCLAHLPDMMRIFCSGHYNQYDIKNPPSILYETAALVRAIWSQPVRYIEPYEFYEKCGAVSPVYKLGKHEDCMEFFLFMVNHLYDDCSVPYVLPETPTPREIAWFNQFQGRDSPFIRMFFHQIRIVQFCIKCNHKSLKFEIESTLMLSIPNSNFRLLDTYAEYMADFTIDGVRCTKCNVTAQHRKEICVEPKVLVIVLKRYIFDMNSADGLKKNNSLCTFPETDLRFGRYIYRLSAIAMHMGSLEVGHYSAAAYTPNGWYEFNDVIVRPFDPWTDDVKRKACAFFYTMCDEFVSSK